jgi:hypothetical protein
MILVMIYKNLSPAKTTNEVTLFVDTGIILGQNISNYFP